MADTVVQHCGNRYFEKEYWNKENGNKTGGNSSSTVSPWAPASLPVVVDAPFDPVCWDILVFCFCP